MRRAPRRRLASGTSKLAGKLRRSHEEVDWVDMASIMIGPRAVE
jgi:hypothetical protein